MERFLDRSVTELEIRHAVLNHKDSQEPRLLQTFRHSLFYFRSPDYARNFPPEKAKIFLSDGAESSEKLEALKKEIVESGAKVRQNYATSEELGSWLLADLTEKIESEFPMELHQDPEQSAQNDVFDQLTKLYTPRTSCEKFLEDFVFGQQVSQSIFSPVLATQPSQNFDGSPPVAQQPNETTPNTLLLISGESGCGKTSFLANTVRQYKEKGHVSGFHFVGASISSTVPAVCLKQIMLQLSEKTGVTNELLSDQPNDETNQNYALIEAFPSFLDAVSKKIQETTQKPAIIIVDGIDFLNGCTSHQPSMCNISFLPRKFPPFVRFIVSTSQDSGVRQALKQRSQEYLMPPLTADEKALFIGSFLRQRSKALSDTQTNEIVRSSSTNNILFLKSVLDELCVFGHFEKLTSRISFLLQTETPKNLFLTLIDRLQEDFGANTVKNVLGVLCCSRGGLSESEIMKMLSIPMTTWSPLFAAISGFFMLCNGLWQASQTAFLSAVRSRFLQSHAEEIEFREMIIKFFSEQKETAPRRLFEVPHQLKELKKFQELHRELTSNIRVFSEMWTVADLCEDLKKYTGLLIKHGFDPEQAFLLLSNEASPSSLQNMCAFFQAVGKYAAAEKLLSQHMSVFQEGTEGEADLLKTMAWLAYKRKSYAECEKYHLRALEILREILSNSSKKIDSTSQPEAEKEAEKETEKDGEKEIEKETEKETEKKDEKMESAKEGEEEGKKPETETEKEKKRGLSKFRQKILIRKQVSSLSGLGVLMKTQNKFSQALVFYQEAMSLSDERSLQTSWIMHNMGVLLSQMGNPLDAEPMFLKSIEHWESIMGPRHVGSALRYNALAKLYTDTGKYSEAERLYLRSLRVREELLGPDHPDCGFPLVGLAELCTKQQKFLESEKYWRRALEVQEKALGFSHLVVLDTVSELITLLVRLHRKEEAKILLESYKQKNSGHTQALTVLDDVKIPAD
eukprot:TRINITY_DN7791_c2_g1_i1.p1 TRINITY_DN7791_c2_g1~~TRINITY_DN7791_c2_g1_i1.p1  ORF type:complete len:1075 (-),score=260.28 TRINITY_DN7791_c2_g1_i1:30-2930(-)